jgi:hypothetical protein
MIIFDEQNNEHNEQNWKEIILNLQKELTLKHENEKSKIIKEESL